jgi:hypothetical protein
MDVFVKEISARKTIRAHSCHRPFCIGKRHIAGRFLPDDLVQPGVASETQCIQIARGGKFQLCFRKVAQRQRALCPAETQLCKRFINQLCLLELDSRLLEIAGSLGFRTGFKMTLPVVQLRLGKISAVQRRKRSAILQVHGYGAQDNFRTAAFARGNNVFEILLKVFINRSKAWIGARNFVFHEHPHSFPRADAGRVPLSYSAQPLEQLSGPGGFQRESGADHGQRRRLISEDSSRAERPDHFVVPHVNHPNIGVSIRAVARQRADDMRVDGGHGGVHDFKLLVGMPQLQHGFQHAGQSEARLRIAISSGFAEDKNPDGSGRLFARDRDRARLTGGVRTKESPAELVVLHKGFFALVD